MTATAIKPSCSIKLGLDFDNTIVCYDAAIEILAEEMFDLPPEIPRTKLGLRNYLRAEGREPEWTLFQGELYGPGMRHAQPFDGAIETMLKLVAAGHELVIVSHRSRRPYAGEPHDLHAAARGWVAERLQSTGLFGSVGDKSDAHFLETRDQKLAMITQLGCDAFLDDLPEVFLAQGYPHATTAILFYPSGIDDACEGGTSNVITSWSQLSEKLFSL